MRQDWLISSYPVSCEFHLGTLDEIDIVWNVTWLKKKEEPEFWRVDWSLPSQTYNSARSNPLNSCHLNSLPAGLWFNSNLSHLCAWGFPLKDLQHDSTVSPIPGFCIKSHSVSCTEPGPALLSPSVILRLYHHLEIFPSHFPPSLPTLGTGPSWSLITFLSLGSNECSLGTPACYTSMWLITPTEKNTWLRRPVSSGSYSNGQECQGQGFFTLAQWIQITYP